MTLPYATNCLRGHIVFLCEHICDGSGSCKWHAKTMAMVLRANECAEPLDARRHRGCRGESTAAVARCLQEHGFLQVDIQEGGADPSASHEERTADLKPKTPSRLSRTRRSTHATHAMNGMLNGLWQ